MTMAGLRAGAASGLIATLGAASSVQAQDQSGTASASARFEQLVSSKELPPEGTRDAAD